LLRPELNEKYELYTSTYDNERTTRLPNKYLGDINGLKNTEERTTKDEDGVLKSITFTVLQVVEPMTKFNVVIDVYGNRYQIEDPVTIDSGNIAYEISRI